MAIILIGIRKKLVVQSNGNCESNVTPRVANSISHEVGPFPTKNKLYSFNNKAISNKDKLHQLIQYSIVAGTLGLAGIIVYIVNFVTILFPHQIGISIAQILGVFQFTAGVLYLSLIREIFG